MCANNMCLPGSLKEELDWSLSLGVGCLAWLLTIAVTMAEISTAVRGRGDSSLSAWVGTRLLLLDSEAWGALFELLVDKDSSTVLIMLGMSAEVTVLGVLSSSVRRGLFSAPGRSPSSLLRLFPLVAGGDVDLFAVLDLVVSFFWVGFFLLVLLLGMAWERNATNFE